MAGLVKYEISLLQSNGLDEVEIRLKMFNLIDNNGKRDKLSRFDHCKQ